MLKREPPIDFVRYGAVSLPIRHSPVKALVQDPSVPRKEGDPPTLIEKVYESFYVDARIAKRGRIRGATIEEAEEKGLPILCLSSEMGSRNQSGVCPELLGSVGLYRKQARGAVFLIPIRLSECDIPHIEIDDGRTLDRIQHVDLFPLVKWPIGLEKLIAALKSCPGHP